MPCDAGQFAVQAQDEPTLQGQKTGKIIATTPSQAFYLHSSHNETFTLVLYVQQTIDWGVCPWQDVVTICASVDFE